AARRRPLSLRSPSDLSVQVRTLPQNARRDEDQELSLVIRRARLLEQAAENGNIAQQGNFVLRIAAFRLENAAENHGLTIVDEHLRHDLPGVDARDETARRARDELAVPILTHR